MTSHDATTPAAASTRERTRPVAVTAAVVTLRHRIEAIRADRRGQTTAEYALVLLGAATVAMLLVAWAGESNRIGALFDTVMRTITGLVA